MTRIASGENGFLAPFSMMATALAEIMIAPAISKETVCRIWSLGARSDDDGATDAGAVYILFMNSSVSVASHQKISATDGGFTETLVTGNFFGYGVAGIGDYNGDGVPDIAVSAPTAADSEEGSLAYSRRCP